MSGWEAMGTVALAGCPSGTAPHEVEERQSQCIREHNRLPHAGEVWPAIGLLAQLSTGECLERAMETLARMREAGSVDDEL